MVTVRFLGMGVLSASALVAGLLLTTGGCTRDPCEHPDSESASYACEGNTLVASTSYGCAAATVSRSDCGHAVCVPGRGCEQPCTTDADCATGMFCSTEPTTADGRRTCQTSLEEGADCSNAPTHCTTGLVCAPAIVWDAGVKDAAAADAGGRMVCQRDCSWVDAAAVTCPVGATSVCVGNRPTGCSCGMPSIAETECAPTQFCVFATTTGTAVCALAPDPDPTCSTLPDGIHCSGNAIFTCAGGYLTDHKDCGGAFSCPGDGSLVNPADCYK